MEPENLDPVPKNMQLLEPIRRPPSDLGLLCLSDLLKIASCGLKVDIWAFKKVEEEKFPYEYLTEFSE